MADGGRHVRQPVGNAQETRERQFPHGPQGERVPRRGAAIEEPLARAEVVPREDGAHHQRVVAVVVQQPLEHRCRAPDLQGLVKDVFGTASLAEVQQRVECRHESTPTRHRQHVHLEARHDICGDLPHCFLVRVHRNGRHDAELACRVDVVSEVLLRGLRDLGRVCGQVQARRGDDARKCASCVGHLSGEVTQTADRLGGQAPQP
mmetsp:Transcript_79332/g.224375  ORF Transcript_79332/g.224375 Transcript_79332/m.224375 type:complete len:205 (-) Transcript_79332:12-626(-)